MDKKAFITAINEIPEHEIIPKEHVIKLCYMAYGEGKFDGMVAAMVTPQKEPDYDRFLRNNA
jgi:hypothetical protein